MKRLYPQASGNLASNPSYDFILILDREEGEEGEEELQTLTDFGELSIKI